MQANCNDIDLRHNLYLMLDAETIGGLSLRSEPAQPL